MLWTCLPQPSSRRNLQWWGQMWEVVFRHSQFIQAVYLPSLRRNTYSKLGNKGKLPWRVEFWILTLTILMFKLLYKLNTHNRLPVFAFSLQFCFVTMIENSRVFCSVLQLVNDFMFLDDDKFVLNFIIISKLIIIIDK